MRKRRLFFDERKVPGDVADVLGEAAALLEVTEFEFFRIAYRRWFGTDTPDEDLERLYLPYMFRGRGAPAVAQMMAEAEAEALDPRNYGVLPRPLSMGMYNRGLRYLLWITVILGTLFTGAATVAELTPWYQSCYLPPCY